MATTVDLTHAIQKYGKTTSVDLSLAMEQLNLNLPANHTPRPDTFHLFSQLAPELRLKIWSHACFPRVLPIRYHSTSASSRASRTVTTKFTSPAAPPALLSVSHEARAQALTIYTLSFATTTSPGTIYVNPGCDTLYFPRTGQMGYDEKARDFRLNLAEERDERRRGGKSILSSVRSIALDYVDVNIKRPWEGYNKACLIRSFPHLEEILLVVRPRIPGSRVHQVVGEAKGKEVGFCVPKIDPVTLLRWWAGFRQSFVMEENELEERCRGSGREYERYTLPVVRSVGRCG